MGKKTGKTFGTTHTPPSAPAKAAVEAAEPSVDLTAPAGIFAGAVDPAPSVTVEDDRRRSKAEERLAEGKAAHRKADAEAVSFEAERDAYLAKAKAVKGNPGNVPDDVTDTTVRVFLVPRGSYIGRRFGLASGRGHGRVTSTQFLAKGFRWKPFLDAVVISQIEPDPNASGGNAEAE